MFVKGQNFIVKFKGMLARGNLTEEASSTISGNGTILFFWDMTKVTRSLIYFLITNMIFVGSYNDHRAERSFFQFVISNFQFGKIIRKSK